MYSCIRALATYIQYSNRVVSSVKGSGVLRSSKFSGSTVVLRSTVKYLNIEHYRVKKYVFMQKLSTTKIPISFDSKTKLKIQKN